MSAQSLLALVILTVVGRSLAWHGNGHYMVAYIAQQYLLQTNPDAFKWANDLLLPYTDMCGETFYPFVESAIWADKIKDQGWHVFDDHHFFSNWWYDAGAVKQDDPEVNPSANAIFSIKDNIATLSSTQEDPYGSSKSLLGKSMSLRFLVHFVGDLHQPLHASERVTPNHPNGDMGGNLFKILHYNQPGMDNLHFVWDEMFNDFNESIRSNLNKERYMFIKRKSDEILLEYTFERLQPQIFSNSTVESWSNESVGLAKAFVFKGLQEGKELPQAYQDEGRRICRERVALAGYRLGMIISDIYKNNGSGKRNYSNKLKPSAKKPSAKKPSASG